MAPRRATGSVDTVNFGGPLPRHPDLRAAVLRASAAWIAERGPASLSLREIARAAGVSHQAPYRHFPDREAVVAALAEEGYRALEAALRPARAAASRAEALEVSARGYLSFALANPGHYRVMFRRDLLPDDAPHVDAAAADAYAELLWLAEQVCADRAFPADVEVATAWLWSLVHGLALLLLDGPLPVRGAARPALDLSAAAAEVTARLVAGPPASGAAPPA